MAVLLAAWLLMPVYAFASSAQAVPAVTVSVVSYISQAHSRALFDIIATTMTISVTLINVMRLMEVRLRTVANLARSRVIYVSLGILISLAGALGFSLTQDKSLPLQFFGEWSVAFGLALVFAVAMTTMNFVKRIGT